MGSEAAGGQAGADGQPAFAPSLDKLRGEDRVNYRCRVAGQGALWCGVVPLVDLSRPICAVRGSAKGGTNAIGAGAPVGDALSQPDPHPIAFQINNFLVV